MYILTLKRLGHCHARVSVCLCVCTHVSVCSVVYGAITKYNYYTHTHINHYCKYTDDVMYLIAQMKCMCHLSILFQGFVLMVTISREAYDDLKRFLRDREANSQKYTKLTCNGEKT